MAKVTQAQFLERYTQGIQGAGTKFEQGVDNSDPWAENYSAPEAQQRMAQGLQEAIAEGRPAAGATALGTGGWRNRTKAKSGNYTGSAQRAASALTPHIPQILAAGDAAKQAAQAVTGPKNRATAASKMVAAMNAIKDTWGKP